MLFPGRADGSQVSVDGKVVGSSLIGQDFEGQRATSSSRPSQTGYSADATYFSNLGPNSLEARELLRANLDAYLRLRAALRPRA